ncbi:MAG TPA: lamin tail domain-containing protein, partial [Pirellulales bacterium]
FSQRASELNVAIIGESARWGDNRSPSVPYTAANRNANVQSLLTNYFPQRTQIVINQFIAAGWFPSLAAPVYSQFGGTVNTGFSLSLSLPGSAPAGSSIYYTLDNSDPRLTGGTLSSAAHLYSGAISITAAEHVKARLRDNSGNWSPLTDAIFTLTTPHPVRIVEMSYHPPDRPGITDSDDEEFIELLNTGTQAIDLNGVKIDTAITYQFNSSLMLGAGQRIVIARTPSVFQSVYGTGVNLAPGNYSGKLANSGEEIRLLDPFGDVLQDFTFSDSGAWSGRADGKGSTLEIINPLGDPNDPTNWRSSYQYGGTPGTAGLGAVNRVVVNEVLTHEDSPAVDAIELYNTTASAINIGNWYLSDGSDNYKKYRIPAGTTIGAGQYLVIDATQFDPAMPTGGNIAFGLSGSSDDDVYLLSADASGNLLNFEDHAEFDAAADNVSFGRWPNGTGKLYPMSSITLGAANSGPLIGPVVISELMINPPGGNANLRFVELENISNQSVTLSSNIPGFSQEPWTIDSLNYSFPLGTTMMPGSTLVVVPFDPNNPANAALLNIFRTTYGIGPSVTLVGGFTGTLISAGQDVRLLRPDNPSADNPTVLPYVLVDEVNYLTSSPWPALVNNNSLTRNLAAVYGDEPTNWNAAAATPGQADLYPPQVAQVFVSSANWSQDYLNYLQSLGQGSAQFGYAIPKGAGQAANLYWSNLNQISIQFTEAVSSQQASLALAGVSHESYAISNYSYDAATHTATWTLASPLPADQLQLDLSSAADGVGHPLDGEWVDNVSTNLSGNGLPGGDFVFSFNVTATAPANIARGDTTLDGQLSSADISQLMQALSNLSGYEAASHLSATDMAFVLDV